MGFPTIIKPCAFYNNTRLKRKQNVFVVDETPSFPFNEANDYVVNVISKEISTLCMKKYNGEVKRNNFSQGD